MSAGSAASPTLTEDQVRFLSNYGTIRQTSVGQVLSRSGDIFSDFIVVVEGQVEALDDFAGESRTMGVLSAGNFGGELNLLTGQALYLSFVVRQPGKVLTIPRTQLKAVVTEDTTLSDIILKAFLARRSIGMRAGVGLRIIGSRHSHHAASLREYVTRNSWVHGWIEFGEDPEAEALLQRFGATPSDLPVAIWQGKEVLKNPTNAELARAIGLQVDAPAQVYDLVVVGAGPAGLGASVYGASEGLSTLNLESTALGGQAGTSSRIENYLGFPAGLSGFELASRALVQADKFGARTAVPQEAVGLTRQRGGFRIELMGGGHVVARTVIAATGARYRRLQVPHLELFEGAGIHYAASEAEALRCEGEEVAVVGGGNSAGQAALFLAGRTPRVYMLIRGDALANTMSSYLADRVLNTANIELLVRTEVRALNGEGRLEGLVVQNTRSGELRNLDLRALFIFIGAQANTGWLETALELDDSGFILTGREVTRLGLKAPVGPHLTREPHLLETSLPGVFAAGDVRSGSVKRVASAVGEGAMAVRFVHQCLSELVAEGSATDHE